MTATAARIGFVTQQYRTTVSSDADVKTAYGEKARDTKDEPVETFFEDVDDADVIADERLALLSAGRRRFRQEANEVLSFTGALDFSQATPAATVIDDERDADPAAIEEAFTAAVREVTMQQAKEIAFALIQVPEEKS